MYIKISAENINSISFTNSQKYICHCQILLTEIYIKNNNFNLYKFKLKYVIKRKRKPFQKRLF